MPEKKISKNVILTVDYQGKSHSVEAVTGMRLLDAVTMAPDVQVDAPCGGNGTCGKCKVKVLSGEGDDGVGSPTEIEKELLSGRELESGIRLSCRTLITGDCHISILQDADEAEILSDTTAYQGELDPPIRKIFLELPKPSLEDQRPDDRRLLDTLRGSLAGETSAEAAPVLSLEQQRRLPHLLRDSDFRITVLSSDRRLYSIETGSTAARSFGIAVDIGTTTVVSYLVDLLSGQVVDTVSGLNHQKAFGGDVISRIEYVMRGGDALERLREKILRQIEGMTEELVMENELKLSEISAMTVAGNTTMMHLFSGFDASAIAAAPFIPVSLGPDEVSAEEFGFEKLQCPVFLLPSISGYVGADISSGIVASKLLDREKPNLLVDIGTNGEIVLGSREGLYSCSTAAGPAFEGAQISRGMGGITGAINTLRLAEDHLAYTTIGGKAPRGICGSGIVDIAAVLVSSKAAEYTGRIMDREEADGKRAEVVLDRRTEENNEPAIELAHAEDTESGEAILFTQKDLREVQLAKAAIAAGIETLVHEAGIEYKDIEKVHLAGGFGSFIDTGSAVDLGMFHRELAGRIESVGNSAGKGAVEALLSRKVMQRLAEIREHTRYIELSSSPFFQNAYIEHMYFPMVE